MRVLARFNVSRYWNPCDDLPMTELGLDHAEAQLWLREVAGRERR